MAIQWLHVWHTRFRCPKIQALILCFWATSQLAGPSAATVRQPPVVDVDALAPSRAVEIQGLPVVPEENLWETCGVSQGQHNRQ
uniref:Uncharacterized protein n=1 Tax=Rhipicephalus zambeziensis TaxID=60191 RepID=A0A224Y8B7_9ACAR